MLTETSASLSSKLVYLEKGTRTILRNARVIDGTGSPPREPVTITIDDARITSINGAAAPTSATTREYDARGLTVIPGLIDLHVHFTGEFGRTGKERYAIDVWEYYRATRAMWHAAQTLEAGFTTVRCLGHGPASLSYGLRRAVTDGVIAGPRILTCGWAISQTGGHGDPHFLPPDLVQRFRPRSAFADGPVECRRMVRQNFGEGADCIKIYATEGGMAGDRKVRGVANFTVEEIKAMTDEAHSRGARVAAHAESAIGIRNAVLGGVDTIEHGGSVWEAPDVIDLMIERGITLVPTLTVYELNGTGDDEVGVTPHNARMAREWLDCARRHLLVAKERGLRIGCGTDMNRWAGGNGRELGLLVECGLSPLEAITTATRSSAEALGLEEHVGTLQPGRLGEMLVLTVDPLADIASLCDKRNIKWIFKCRDQLT